MIRSVVLSGPMCYSLGPNYWSFVRTMLSRLVFIWTTDTPPWDRETVKYWGLEAKIYKLCLTGTFPELLLKRPLNVKMIVKFLKFRKPKCVVRNWNQNNGHENSNNYHDENHDEIELYHGNSKRSTEWHSTPEQRAPKTQSCRLWWGAADQCTMPHGTYIQIMIYRLLNYTIEMRIWNQTGKNNSILPSNTPSWSYQLLKCMSLRKTLFWLLRVQL